MGGAILVTHAMVRLLAIITSLLVLGIGVFLVYDYYESNLVLLQTNPSYSLDVSRTLLDYLLVVAIVGIALLSLVVYLLLTMRVVARRMAYTMTRNISMSQEQFRKFYELSPVPYLLISRDGLIERPNTAALRLFALTAEELIGQNIFDYIQVPDHPDKIGVFREQVRRKVPVEQKEVQVTPPHNRTPRWSLLSIEDLTDSGAGHRGLVTLVDIHEQKELDRIKTEFLSLASHQLRAPLANLKWYIDFLLNRRATALTEEVADYLRKMYHRNEDMIDLVNTLLNLSRIEMGRVKVQKERTDISGLLRSIVEELAPEATEKNITLVSNLDPMLEFETDRRLLRIVLQNLLSNALRYTPKDGKVVLSVTTVSSGIRISVQDTGIGIPPEEQGRIFQKLYRATNAKVIEANGNGIGLYMCKALVEGLGGTISFTTALGQGTTFIVDLSR